MKGLLVAVTVLVSCASAEWCCGDIHTKVKSEIKAVVRSRTIQMPQTQYYKLRTGYELCPNNTVAEPDVPKGLGRGSDDTPDNRNKLGWGSGRFNLLDLLTKGKLGNGEFHGYCPVYTTKSRRVVGYQKEYYNSAMFEDKKASCPASKKVCCKGYKKVGDNCIDESKADSAASSLDFLNSLGIVG